MPRGKIWLGRRPRRANWLGWACALVWLTCASLTRTTWAAAVLAAEEALEGALKDLSDDSMSLLTTVYEILDVINLLEPDMVEDTARVGTFNTAS